MPGCVFAKTPSVPSSGSTTHQPPTCNPGLWLTAEEVEKGRVFYPWPRHEIDQVSRQAEPCVSGKALSAGWEQSHGRGTLLSGAYFSRCVTSPFVMNCTSNHGVGLELSPSTQKSEKPVSTV